MSREAKTVFSPGPMVFHFMVSSVGSRHCQKRRCKVRTNVTETDTFSSIFTSETFQINHERNCNDKYLIYLLQCRVCKKQYVGETTDEFRLRWDHYKGNDKKFQRNETCMQQHLYEHFYSKGHNGFLVNVSISLIDKTDGFQPKKRENYWMKNPEYPSPLGLNVESTAQHFIC